MIHHPSLSPVRAWRAALTLAVISAATLAACGGGGDAGTAAAPPTGTTASASGYTLGTINGFGSVVVGGVRYDESKARVLDEDDAPKASTDLKLGMQVQINAGKLDAATGMAVAERVRFGSDTIGPVGVVNTAASTVTVLGQTVVVNSNTVFDSTLVGGLSALTAGSVVEVHGILDQATGKITATRIEPEVGAIFYRLRGVVTALDTTAKTFKIGTEVVSYAGLAAADVPPNLANGLLVRVRLTTAQVAGAWVATKLNGGLRLPEGSVPDAHVEGAITAFTSAAAFELNGLKVDARNASFPDGSTGIALGARVEVTGSVTAGVLVATKVEVEERREGGMRPLELHGAITSVDAAAKTLVLRTVTVSYAGNVSFKDGTIADLAAGKKVEVYGVLSADRTRLEAQRIEFQR